MKKKKASAIKVTRAASLQVVSGILVSHTDQFIVTCPLDQVDLSEAKLAPHVLVEQVPQVLLGAENRLTKQQTQDLLVALGVPNKLTRKCESILTDLGDFCHLQLDSAPWLIWWAKDAGTHHPLQLLNCSELDTKIHLLDTQSPADCDLVRRKLEWADTPVTLDLETFGWDDKNKNGLVPWLGDIRMIQLSVGEDSECYIFDLGPRWDRQDDSLVAQLIREILPGRCIWGQNLKFDLLWLLVKYNVDLSECRVEDSWIWSKVAWSGIQQYRHDLASICARVHVECHDKTLQKADFGGHLLACHYNYGAFDVWNTRKAIVRLKASYGPQVGGIVYQTARLCITTTYMNFNGYPVDTELVEADCTPMKARWEALREQIRQELQIKNPASNKQLKEALNIRWNTTLPDVDVSTLRTYEYKDEALIAILREFNSLGLAVNCGDAILRSLSNPHHSHTNYSPLNPQASGRVSASAYNENFGFNGLNISKPNEEFDSIVNMRAWFKAPPGKKIITVDMSGSHAKIALEASGQLDMLEALNTHEDGHAENAVYVNAQLHGPDHEFSTLEGYFAARQRKDPEVKVLRDMTKTTFYSQINVCSPQSLQASFSKVGIQKDIKTCETVLSAMWDRCPKILNFIKSKVYDSKDKGVHLYDPRWCRKRSQSVEDFLRQEKEKKTYKPLYWTKMYSPFVSRYRYLPVYERFSERTGKTYSSLGHAVTAGCLWAPVESHIMIETIERVFRGIQLAQPHTGTKIWGSVYDELDLEVKEEYALEVAEQVKVILNEEWSKVLTNVAVTGPANDLIGGRWSEVH